MDEKHMYLMEQEVRRLQQGEFDGCHIAVFHINHFMDNSLKFNEALKALFGELVFLGVPYHTRVRHMEERFFPGYPCYYGKWEEDSFVMYCNGMQAGCYKGDFQEVCEKMLEAVLVRELLPAVRRGMKILLLEDGGYVCQYLGKWKEKYPELLGKIVGSVEQTTSGTRLARRHYKAAGYPFPCISIARSDLKMDIEAHFIGGRIMRELDHILYGLDTFLEFHQVLLLGYGVLGHVAAGLLKGRNVRILVYDIDRRMRSLARQEGYCVADGINEIAFPVDTVVVGMTGEESFTMEMLELFRASPAKRLYLASGSSKQVEFRAFLQYARDNGRKAWEKPYYLEAGKKGETKEVYLLAEGMPLNFYRGTEGSLTYSVIDFIFTEMLLCACRLAQKNSLEKRMYLAGAYPVPGLDEKRLFEKWCGLYGLWADYPGGHPEKEYLRRMADGERG